MEKEKYGFVYIWRDCKYNRYYIGCHFGNINDGYICSSIWMRNSYKKRSHDFKRRVLITNIYDRKQTLEEEHKWLNLIPNEKLGKSYYNLSKCSKSHWSLDEEKRLTVGEKISKAKTGKPSWKKGKPTGKPSWNKGKTFSKEHREKLSKARLGKSPSNDGKGKGFWKRKNENKWVAAININGKQEYLGTFDCPAAAHFAYIIAVEIKYNKTTNIERLDPCQD